MTNLSDHLDLKFSDAAKPFSEDDIQWVAKELKLPNGFDVHQQAVLQHLGPLDVAACPGSGKTTVLVAKLALLARYWTSTKQGICIISMTNAAREEIQERLGHTQEGQKLLKPPHFIGTIHSFFSEFLAKPYLNSRHMPLVSIDDDHCRSQRRKLLQTESYLPLTDHLVSEQVKKKQADVDKAHDKNGKNCRKNQAWLDEHEQRTEKERRLKVPIHDWRIGNINYDVFKSKEKGDEPLELSTEHLEKASQCVKEIAQSGIFYFSDIFVFASALMDSTPSVFKIIRTRFPLLFVDEAQDTSFSQAQLIHRLMLDDTECSFRVTRQRFGDANQTIYTFEKPGKRTTVDPYPCPQSDRLTLPVSHRFDQSIASLASRFETLPFQPPMEGVRKDHKHGRQHCILLFDENTRSSVIANFAEYVAEQLTREELTNAKIRVCAHKHKDEELPATDTDFARTIGDYYAPYIAKKLSKDYQQHGCLQDYLEHARFLLKESKSYDIALEKFAEGVLKGCFNLSSDEELDITNTLYAKIKSNPKKHLALIRSLNNQKALNYKKALVTALGSQGPVTEDDWTAIYEQVSDCIQYLLFKTKTVKELPKIIKDSQYFQWQGQEFTEQVSDVSTIDRDNTYQHQLADNKGQLPIKMGTIHSFKGQTHTATLLLESTNRGPVLGKLKAYLLGIEDAKNANDTNKDWLNTLYVGLTRPTHLVCIALPVSHKYLKKTIDWTDKDLAKLKVSGWQIAKVTEDNVPEMI